MNNKGNKTDVNKWNTDGVRGWNIVLWRACSGKTSFEEAIFELKSKQLKKAIRQKHQEQKACLRNKKTSVAGAQGRKQG